VAARRTTLAALQKQLAALSVTSGTADTAALQLLSSHDQRLAALNSALSTRVAYDRVLRQLALVLPDDVWLDGLTFGGAAGLSTTPTAAAPATPGAAPTSDTQITGATYTTDGVARFLQRLSVLPTLENVALQSTTLQQRGGKDVYAFTITADVVKGAGS
jgi:Tfp pilus assembly protein PilN